MTIKAQVAMVMNLDKCIGCHTCSVTCKQVWTNRPGAEYAWFNNVETRPGLGYPKRWSDQEQWRGGWELDRRGRLRLRAGGRVKKLASIFWNPDLPELDDYYDPWTYDYETLISAPLQKHDPVATSHSQLTGKAMNVEWGPNWDDNLAGGPETAMSDPLINGELVNKVKMEYEQAFMFYLPRICEHCLNPSCVASCPSGAMYKREEDGIVLVDQDKCRGWRFCVSGCPYKKVYFNHKSGKAEKCTLCYPRIEAGQPTICSETCVGRIRYLGLLLYDADRVEAAARCRRARPARRSARPLPRPRRPRRRRRALADGISPDWIEHAQRSPVHALVARYKVALPLHPEYRTCRWSGTSRHSHRSSTHSKATATRPTPTTFSPPWTACGSRSSTSPTCSPQATPTSSETCSESWQPCAATCESSRCCTRATSVSRTVGMTGQELEDMYRLLAIAKYEERYVIPQAHAELADRLAEQGAGRRMQPRLRGRPRKLRSSRPGHTALVHADRAPRTAPFLTAARTEGDPATSPTRRASCRMSRPTPPVLYQIASCYCATHARRCSPPTPRSPPRWPNSPARTLECRSAGSSHTVARCR